MNQVSFIEFFEQAPCMLGEGAVIERLRRNKHLELDPFIVNSAFIYDSAERNALETIYRQYLDIGRKYKLPVVLSTPTWRASQERITQAGYGERDVNGDNFRFLDGLRKGYDDHAGKIWICGLMSCRGDAYNPQEAMSLDDARAFHAWQAERLAKSGVDFILAATLPALSEAMGLAKALADTGVPYIISFVARPEGTLLDGTPLKEAIRSIDAKVHPKPFAYMINCTHASFFRSALLHEQNADETARKRIVGLFANTAVLNPEELNDSDALVAEDPDLFGQAVGSLHKDMGMKILGGCCGTDERHIEKLAIHLKKQGVKD